MKNRIKIYILLIMAFSLIAIGYSSNASSQKIKDNGIYKLAIGRDESKVIEVKSGSTTNDAIVDIGNYQGKMQQKFYIEYQKEGFYIIKAFHTGKSLTAKNGQIKEGTEIVQSEYKELESQKWTIRDSNKNGWVISPLSNSNLAISVQKTIVNGEKIILSKTRDNDNQMLYMYNISKEEQKHSNGIYKIVVGKDSSKSLEIKNADKSNNAIMDIWNYENLSYQKFKLEYQKDGFYKITVIHTGKSLTIKDGQIKESANIVQYDYQGLESQKWLIRDSNINGWIISPLSNPTLSVSIEGTMQKGSKIILNKTKDNDNQMFYMYNITAQEKEQEQLPNTGESKHSDGIYNLAIGKDATKSIEVLKGNTNDGATVDIGIYSGALQQKFYLEYQKEGFYKITAMHTGKSLTVKNGQIKEGTEIVQYEYKGLVSQKWILRDSKINGWIISPLSNPGLALSIQGKIQNGSIIILSKTKNNDNQMLYMFNISKEEKKQPNGIYNIAVGKDSKKSMDVLKGNKNNGATVDICNYEGNPQQKFYLEYQDEGFYKITVSHTGKSLTAKNDQIKEGTEIVQNEYKGQASQKWILRDSNKNGWIISPLNNPELAMSVQGTIQNGSKIILSKTKDNDNQMFYLFKLGSVINIDSSKYPGFTEKIEKLSKSHPNWEFEVLYTTLDFNTAVQKEYEYASKQGNLVYTPTYKGDWIAPNPYISGNWASASYNGIAYFMDPRNFLNDVDVFQFIDLSDYSSSGVTIKSIQYQVEGTFLQDYANDIMNACKNTNINPYYTIARLFQEQGIKGSSTIYMDGKDGKLYFNPFNIGAQVGNDYQTALERAKKEGWNSMQKGIEGGVKILKSYYIDKEQNTLYLNKFDVNPASGGGFYNHQYMQNLSAAYSEARILNDAYVDSGVQNNKIKFIIPVYENMSKTVATKPTGISTIQYNDENINNSDRVKVKTSDGSGVNIRSGPGTSYSKIRSVSEGTTGTRIVTGKNFSDDLWWDEVVFDDGTRGFVATKYLQKIN